MRWIIEIFSAIRVKIVVYAFLALAGSIAGIHIFVLNPNYIFLNAEKQRYEDVQETYYKLASGRIDKTLQVLNNEQGRIEKEYDSYFSTIYSRQQVPAYISTLEKMADHSGITARFRIDTRLMAWQQTLADSADIVNIFVNVDGEFDQIKAFFTDLVKKDIYSLINQLIIKRAGIDSDRLVGQIGFMIFVEKEDLTNRHD